MKKQQSAQIRAAAIVAEVTEQYNQIAPYFAETRKKLQWDAVFTDIIKQIPPNARVLDLGCGSGRFYRILQEHGRTDLYYEGLDGSTELIKIAQKEHPEVQFTTGSMTELPYPDTAFDCAIAIASLHHIPEALQNSVMQECQRVLKNNGLCMVTVWHLKNSKPKEQNIPWKKGVHAERYYYNFSANELKNLMLNNSFKNVVCTEINSNFIAYGQK